MYRKFRLVVRLEDNMNQTHAARVMDLGPDVVMFGDRFVDDIKMGSAFIGHADPIQSMARVLHERKFRKDLLVDACKQLGYQIADYLEDSEGWNGQDRQELIKKHR